MPISEMDKFIEFVNTNPQMTKKELGVMFGVSVETIKYTLRKHKTSWVGKTGKPAKVDNLSKIRVIMESKPEMPIIEIKNKLGISCSDATIYNYLNKLGIVRKKIPKYNIDLDKLRAIVKESPNLRFSDIEARYGDNCSTWTIRRALYTIGYKVKRGREPIISDLAEFKCILEKNPNASIADVKKLCGIDCDDKTIRMYADKALGQDFQFRHNKPKKTYIYCVSMDNYVKSYSKISEILDKYQCNLSGSNRWRNQRKKLVDRKGNVIGVIERDELYENISG